MLILLAMFILVSTQVVFRFLQSKNQRVKGKESKGSKGKESAYHARVPRFDLWVKKIPWRREWQPMPVFLPKESHGQRSLASSSPWGLKESDTTECLTLTQFLDYT